MAEVRYKEVLHVFCGKNKLQQPSYTCEDEDGSFYCEVRKYFICVLSIFTVFHPRFCQLRVEGIEFIGCGEAKSKKEAQTAAAKVFCEHLVAQKRIQPSVRCTDVYHVSHHFIAGIGTIKNSSTKQSPPTFSTAAWSSSRFACW